MTLTKPPLPSGPGGFVLEDTGIMSGNYLSAVLVLKPVSFTTKGVYTGT